MAAITTSPNMLLPVPQVGIEDGPQYATDINNCLGIIDQHDHSPNNGVQITPNGLDINADLTFNDNNATSLRSSRYQAQASPLSGAADLLCVYASGVDLYYNDGNGNQVRITQSGGVAGSPGSIANLTSPASASYVSADETFVWQSAANTPANLDAASILLRNLVANSHALTLSPPNSMAADYTITLPSLPASNLPVSINNSGTMSAAAITFAQLAAAVQAIITTPPTFTVLRSGSGTYTTPANVTYLRVRMAGAGGGGGSGGNAEGSPGSAGSAGANSTFGTTLLVAAAGSGGGAGGGAGTNSGGAGGSIGSSSLGSGAGFIVPGGKGNPGAGSLSEAGTGIITSGGSGGANPFGGSGSGGGGNVSGSLAGSAGATNTGAGGGGGASHFSDNYSNNGGAGGGAGAYVEAIISSPNSTYSYLVGAGGAGGTGGGAAGAVGADGIIIVEEHYGS